MDKRSTLGQTSFRKLLFTMDAWIMSRNRKNSSILARRSAGKAHIKEEFSFVFGDVFPFDVEFETAGWKRRFLFLGGEFSLLLLSSLIDSMLGKVGRLVSSGEFVAWLLKNEENNQRSTTLSRIEAMSSSFIVFRFSAF